MLVKNMHDDACGIQVLMWAWPWGIYIQKQTSCLCIDERKRNQWWKKSTNQGSILLHQRFELLLLYQYFMGAPPYTSSLKIGNKRRSDAWHSCSRTVPFNSPSTRPRKPIANYKNWQEWNTPTSESTVERDASTWTPGDSATATSSSVLTSCITAWWTVAPPSSGTLYGRQEMHPQNWATINGGALCPVVQEEGQLTFNGPSTPYCQTVPAAAIWSIVLLHQAQTIRLENSRP